MWRRKSTGQEQAEAPAKAAAKKSPKPAKKKPAKSAAKVQPEQKQQINVYTMMLIISFVATCIACILLWMELQEYAPNYWRTEGVSPAGTSQVAPDLAPIHPAFAVVDLRPGFGQQA